MAGQYTENRGKEYIKKNYQAVQRCDFKYKNQLWREQKGCNAKAVNFRCMACLISRHIDTANMQDIAFSISLPF